MATVTISPSPLGDMADRLQGDQREPLRAVVSEFRKLVAEEFRTESWRPPSGPPRPWPKTKDFGTRRAPAKTMQGSGALLRALQGRGAGAIEVYGPRSAIIGVAGSVLPYAAVHRGGPGKVTAADSRRPFKIRITGRMRGYVAATFAVHFRRTTTHITIPRRPFATDNPEIRTRATAIYGAWAVGRQAPGGLAA